MQSRQSTRNSQFGIGLQKLHKTITGLPFGAARCRQGCCTEDSLAHSGMAYIIHIRCFDSHFRMLLQVTEYWFSKVFYESRVTWKTEAAYLQCSPMFHSHPRYDCVLAHVDDKVVLAQLVYLFAVFVDSKPLLIMLVHLFDRQTTPHYARKDKELGFLRLRRQDTTCFIWARSIIHGVPIFPAFDDKKDLIVFDMVDADMFLRISEILTH